MLETANQTLSVVPGGFPVAGIRLAKDPDLVDLAKRYERSLNVLWAVDDKMNIRQVIALLMVYQDEGKLVAEYADKYGIAPSVMSRDFLDMGEKNRKGLPGLGLFEKDRSHSDLRAAPVYLTRLGRMHAENLLKALIPRKGA